LSLLDQKQNNRRICLKTQRAVNPAQFLDRCSHLYYSANKYDISIKLKPIKTPASAQADQTRQTAPNHREPIQQFATESMFVDNRSEMTAQRQRLSMMSNSPQIQQQKARQNSINNSPQTLAQLKQHSALFGTPMQRQET